MKKFVSSLVTLCLAAVAATADVQIIGPTKPAVYTVARYTLAGVSPKAGVAWRYDKTKLSGGGHGNTRWLTAPPGKYVIEVEVTTYDKATEQVTVEQADLTVEFVAGPDPVPPGPTPPGPVPPVPPVPPGPTPTPSPVPDPGLHVMVVWDVSKPLTKDLDTILHTQSAGGVRDYLTTKCPVVGGKADWAMWHDGMTAEQVKDYPSQPMKTLYARKRASLPWILISKDGSQFYEGPLPPTQAEVLALLRKYGG